MHQSQSSAKIKCESFTFNFVGSYEDCLIKDKAPLYDVLRLSVTTNMYNDHESADTKDVLAGKAALKKESTSTRTAEQLIGLRWYLYNCEEHWMRYIDEGLQIVKWHSYSWFQIRGVRNEEHGSYVEILPSAGRPDVLKVNDFVVWEPRRLQVGDKICVMDEYRWEVRRDLFLKQE